MIDYELTIITLISSYYITNLQLLCTTLVTCEMIQIVLCIPLHLAGQREVAKREPQLEGSPFCTLREQPCDRLRNISTLLYVYTLPMIIYTYLHT